MRMKAHERKGAKNICHAPNPMRTDTKQRALFGFALTNSRTIQKAWGCDVARCEFNRIARVLKRDYGVVVRSKFKCKV